MLLTRLFSIVQWHHFAYMVISMALKLRRMPDRDPQPSGQLAGMSRKFLRAGQSQSGVRDSNSQMSRANRAFDVSQEIGSAAGTPGDQRLSARKLSAFDSPLRAALHAWDIGFEPVSAAVFWIFRIREPNVPQLHNRTVACATALEAVTRSLRRTRSSGVGHSL